MTEQINPLVETVTKELLERELNSDRFISGLEKTIELAEFPRPIVNGNRLEVSFDVEKQLFGNGINYSPDIIIGNERSVSRRVSDEFAEELYRKHTGKNPRDDDNLEDFVCFCSEHRLNSEEYPNVENKFKFSYKEPKYVLLHLHTHPNSGPSPSPGDGKFMTYLRNQTKEYGFFARPIMIIAGCTDYDSRNKIYPLLFLQEKADIPLNEKETQEAISYAIRFTGKNEREHSKLNLDKKDELARKFIMALGKGIFDTKKTKKYKPLYNCGLAYFRPGDSKLDFDFDLGKFAYEAREVV